MQSVWSINNNLEKQSTLQGDVKTDVLIIGGGMAGILTSYRLKQKGVDNIVVESGRVAGGVTKNTTAKITAQHGIIYKKLIDSYGVEKAQQYANANIKAVKEFEAVIEKNKINCDFEKQHSYLYAIKNEGILQDEAASCEKAGLKVKLTDKTSLPFDVKSALMLEDQAQFDPLAFINGIMGDLTIYENTKVIDVKENTAVTEGGKITAKKIIVAAHFPFINAPGYYFMRMHQERSYVVALKGADKLDGMYLGIDGDKYSFRRFGDYVLLGGSGHRTGENADGGKYDRLAGAAKQFYPNSREECRWSAQDCMTHDGVPYIGHYSRDNDWLYVATGFNKWGMTSSMVSAMILTDMLTEGKTGYEIFSPQRHDIIPSAKGIMQDSAKAVSGLLQQIFAVAKDEIDGIERGNASVVSYEGEKYGVYKDEEGKCFMISTRCPHLGCKLTWNADELSWDCPCHGSRFDYRGNLLNSPSVKNLDVKEE